MMKEPTDKKDESDKKDDRFEKLSNNYGELFTEVFAEQGLDYGKFERSVFDTVDKMNLNKDTPILDIGTGDGATITPFIEADYKDLTGVDLNPQMIEAARKKFGTKANWLQMNATDMSEFRTGQFPVIVTGAAIHNIPKQERIKFWGELLRLSPDVFVSADKISDPDPEKNKADYDSEVAAIRKVYGDKHKLKDAEKEWIDHYEYDEREKLELGEIEQSIGTDYDVEVVFEMGMCKTIVAKKRKK